jgi:hypothetical protein
MQNAHPHHRETHVEPVHQTLAAAPWPAECLRHDEQQRGLDRSPGTSRCGADGTDPSDVAGTAPTASEAGPSRAEVSERLGRKAHSHNVAQDTY